MTREQTFKRVVRRWWKENRRDLPWRRTRNPYRILVSEVMLQQTRVDRVIPKYRAFLKAFPSATSLARSSRSEVIRAWSGLGYNRRAVHLHDAAQVIVRDYRGRIPIGFGELKRFPGVGAYTAKAVLAFAYGAPCVPVDTNVRRVLVRHFGVAPQALDGFAQRFFGGKEAGEWSQALMDFGALVCMSRNPGCDRLGLVHIAEDLAPRFNPGRFEGSNRYWRGRIVEALRRKTVLRVHDLAEEIRAGPELRMSARRFLALLQDLSGDGLIEMSEVGPRSLVRLA